MIDPLKPLGAFIENTIRPLIGEFKWFFDECEKKGIPINEKSVRLVVDYVARAHFRTCLVQFAQAISITLILCATWIISRIYL